MKDEELLGALARGYHTKRNSQKVLDSDLIQDMTKEVEKLIPLELLPKVNGEYQCEHIKDKVIRGNCVWCNLTVAEKIIDRLKGEITELKVKPLEPIDEEEILDFLDNWGYRHRNIPQCNDDDFRKIAHAISAHFGVDKRLEPIDENALDKVLPKKLEKPKPTIEELEKILGKNGSDGKIYIKPDGSITGGKPEDIYVEGFREGANKMRDDCKKSILNHFGVSNKLELLDKDKIIQILYKFDMSKEDCRIDNAVTEIMKFNVEPSEVKGLREIISEKDIEFICAKVHEAYCIYHEERTGKEYWTKGDYFLLKEDSKEYDRRTVKAVLESITNLYASKLSQERLEYILEKHITHVSLYHDKECGSITQEQIIFKARFKELASAIRNHILTKKGI